MMDKETFVKYVEKIKHLLEVEGKINDALYALSPDFGGFSFGDALSDMVDLLAFCVKDDELLSYYVFETECGTNECADSVYDNNDVHIPFKTPADVYDCIMRDSKVDELDKYMKTLEQILKQAWKNNE